MTDQTTNFRPWEAAFLAALREGKGAVAAAAIAGIERSTPYALRRRNARFAREWREAAPAKPGQKSAQNFRRGSQWRKPFLEALAETSNVTAAAARANVPAGTAYKTRRTTPEFRAQWNAALLEGYEHLEMETLHRLRMGVDKDGPRVDLANTLRLLALHKDTVVHARAVREGEDEDAILASLDAKIDAWRARQTDMTGAGGDAPGS